MAETETGNTFEAVRRVVNPIQATGALH